MAMMHHPAGMRRLAPWLVWVLLLSACSVGSPDAETVRKIVDQFYQAQQQQDMDAALKFFSDDRSPETWRLHLQNISKSLGKVERYEFKRVEVNTVFSGRFYIFEYQVAYSSGTDAKETIAPDATGKTTGNRSSESKCRCE